MARPFCAEVSRESSEPLSATASRVDHWLVLEYRGLWAPRPLTGSGLPDAVKTHLEEQVAARPRSRLLFVRQPRRRGQRSIACFAATTREHGSTLVAYELEEYEDLLSIDFTEAAGEPLVHPLLLVCTHGKRDRCCARFGRPLYDALRDAADDDWIWQCSHVGGDRFAGNVVCLPEGLYFGRVDPPDVWRLMDEYVAGRVYLDRFRGRSCYSFPVQAAERAVREVTGRTGIEDLTLRGVERTGNGNWRVRFDAGEADVWARLGDLTYLTCSAEALRRPPLYEARAR